MASTASLFSHAELTFAQVPLSHSAATAHPSDDVPLRPDGRTPLQFRDIILQTDVSHAQGALGSAKVVVEDAAGAGGGSSTEIWAGVRGEVESMDDGQEGGKVVVSLEWCVAGLNSHCRMRQAGGAIPRAAWPCGLLVVLANSRMFCARSAPTALPSLKPDLPIHLASILSSLFSASTLPASLLSQLVILPKSRSWTLYLDILILSSSGGNVIDLATLAARSALATARIPQTRAIGFDEGDEAATAALGEGAGMTSDEGFSGLVKGGKGGSKAVDFELVDGGSQGVRLQGWEELPIGLTLNLVPCAFSLQSMSAC